MFVIRDDIYQGYRYAFRTGDGVKFCKYPPIKKNDSYYVSDSDVANGDVLTLCNDNIEDKIDLYDGEVVEIQEILPKIYYKIVKYIVKNKEFNKE